MKYKILYDYRIEGFKFDDDEYDTLAMAVKDAVVRSCSYAVPFLIVQVIDWEAKITPPHKGE